jgi:hypothetical protein
MQLKRILVSLLVVVLMLSATVFASAEDTVVLTAGAATLGIEVGTTPASVEGNLQAKPGDKIDVSITITNNPGVAKIQVSMAYDANFFAPLLTTLARQLPKVVFSSLRIPLEVSTELLPMIKR